MKKILPISAAVLMLVGCESIQDSKNIFRQPATPGYADTRSPASNGDVAIDFRTIGIGRDPNSANGTRPLQIGECLTIYLVGGETNTDSESGVARLIARASGDQLVSHWALSAQVIQGAVTSTSFKSETTIFESRVRMSAPRNGVSPELSKNLGISDVPIFGPVKWGGLPVSVRITLSELDQAAAARLKTKLDETSDTLRDQLGLPKNASADAIKAVIANGLDAVVKMSTGAYVAIGFEAVKFAADTYNALHAPDDIYIDETVGLAAAADNATGALVLRPGVIVLARSGNSSDRRDLQTGTLNLPKQTLLVKVAGNDVRPIWVAFRIASQPARADGKCASS